IGRAGFIPVRPESPAVGSCGACFRVLSHHRLNIHPRVTPAMNAAPRASAGLWPTHVLTSDATSAAEGAWPAGSRPLLQDAVVVAGAEPPCISWKSRSNADIGISFRKLPSAAFGWAALI